MIKANAIRDLRDVNVDIGEVDHYPPNSDFEVDENGFALTLDSNNKDLGKISIS